MRFFVFIILVLFTFSINAQSIPSYIPTNGLIGYWPLDDSLVVDIHGNNNGFNVGATPATDRHGIADKCLEFNGGSQYALINNTITNNPDSFTVSMWIYLDTINGTSNQNDRIILQHGINGTWKFTSRPADNAIKFVRYVNATTTRTAISFPQSNSWINVVGVFRSTVSPPLVEIYINGVQIDISAANGLWYTVPFTDITIGGDNSGNNAFDGKIDDIAVWDRVLSNTEIQQIFVGCNSNFLSQPQNTTSTDSANFSISHSSLNSTFQWQEYDNNSWSDLSDGVNYTGTQTPDLTVYNLSGQMDGYLYRCIVNGCDLDTSDVAILTVPCFYDITTQPQTQSSVDSCVFIVDHSDPLATYRWQINYGIGWSDLTSSGQFDGTQDKILKVYNVNATLNGSAVRCIIDNQCDIDTSNVAYIFYSDLNLEDNLLENLKVYPNPTSDIITVESEVGYNYRLTSLNGKVLYQFSGNKKIDLSEYPSGSYILEVYLENYLLKRVKVLKAS